MSEQQQVARRTDRSSQYEYEGKHANNEANVDTVRQEKIRKAGELAVEMSDDLLDEIDAVLEMNEETAVNFRQKGGE